MDRTGIWVQFVNELIVVSNSVGIIRLQAPTVGCTGTVFRVGPCHVMTCYHVVKDIHGEEPKTDGTRNSLKRVRFVL